jgi:hypothetical protein
VVGDKSFDPWQCLYEGRGHFTSLELRGSQHKSVYSRRSERGSFSGPVADAIVFSEHNPAALTDFDQPNFVFGIRRKMIVVNLDGFAGLPQRLSYCPPAKGTVDKED